MLKLLLSVVLGATLAAYVDEVALDEAIRVNIGPPIAAAGLGKDALVGTSAGALALVNFKTGALKWRSVRPTGACRSGPSSLSSCRAPLPPSPLPPHSHPDPPSLAPHPLAP